MPTETEHCICAAIRVDPQGSHPLVATGRRHHEIIASLNFLVGWRTRGYEQGFLTNRGRFVSRSLGLVLQIGSGIPSARGAYHNYELFSEDLY